MRTILPILRGILIFCAAFALVEGARADDRALAMAIINKAIEAGGGGEKLAKAMGRTWKEEGTYYGMGDGLPFTATCAVQLPSRFRMDVEAVFVRVFDGDKGWIKANGETSLLKGEELKEQIESNHAGWVTSLVPLADKAFQLKPLGESTVEGKPAHGVQVSHEGRRDVKLFFDAKSGLLVKSETRALAPEQGFKEVTQEVFYDDYQDVGGLRLPMKIAIKRDGEKFVEAGIRELKTAEKLDDALFAKP